MGEIPVTTIVGAAAFAAGIIFGATAQRTNFCTMGAISDMVFMGDFKRFRAWLMAISIGILATQAMHSTGMIDIDKSIYLTSNLGWLGAILGGLFFGFGMTMAGGCGNKTLVRIGGGNLKSLVVFMVVGVTAYMTLRGLIAVARIEMEVTNVNLAKAGMKAQGFPDLLMALGLPAGVARWSVALAFAGGMLAYCFKDSEFRESPRDMVAGLVIGLMVPTGWWITGVLGNDDFSPAPLASFTFVGPIGESLQYLMTFTGATINFGIAAVAGVITGSFLVSIATKSFHLESFSDADDMLRHMAGAVLMGMGGVLAMGCTIGQGLTGMSTLGIGSLIAFLSILAGGVLGMKYLEEGTLGGALRAVFARA